MVLPYNYRVWNSCKMPSTSIIMEGNQVFRYNEKSHKGSQFPTFQSLCWELCTSVPQLAVQGCWWKLRGTLTVRKS